MYKRSILCLIILVLFQLTLAIGNEDNNNFNVTDCKELILSRYDRLSIDTLIACNLVFEKNKKWSWYIHSKNLTTFVYYTIGEVRKAYEFTELALVNAEKHLEKTDTNYLDALHNTAFVYTDRLLYNKAIKLFKEVIKVEKNLPEIENESRAQSYNSLADAYQDIYDFERAILFYKKAINLVEGNIEYRNLPAYYADLAEAYALKGDTTNAIRKYQNSLQLISESDSIYLKRAAFKCYTELSEIYLNQNDTINFDLHNAKAANIFDEFGKSLFNDYTYFELQGDLVVNQKCYNDALIFYEQAEQALIIELEGFQKEAELAKLKGKEGNCYYQLGLLEKALEIYQSGLQAICKKFDIQSLKSNPAIDNFYDKRTGVEILSYKAQAFKQLYTNNKDLKYLGFAHQTYQLIAKLIPLTRRDFLEEGSKFQLANETHSIYEKAIDNCFELYAQTGDKQYLKDAFDFIEGNKAIVLQEMMQANLAIAGLEDTLQQKDLYFKSEIAYFEKLIYTTSENEETKKKLKRWRSELFDLKEAYEDFKTKLEKEKPDFYALKYANQIATVVDIQNQLKTQTALIEYFYGKDHIYVFKIEQHHFEGFKVEKKNGFEEDIATLQKLVTNRPKSGDYDAFKLVSNHIYNEILALPLQSLSDGIKQLTIIPDNALCNISFDVLLSNTNEEKHEAVYHPINLSYLFEDYALSYNYSASLLLRSTDRNEVNHNSNYTGFAPYFKDLLYNQTEVDNINSIFGDLVFIGEDANFGSFKTQAKQTKIVHLATHAKKNETHYMLNEIQFADTTINNYQIENLQIDAALTVLSACETGAGYMQSGEGLMSLSRSFFLAGCPSLVSTLWRAADESTADIMRYFYQNLKDGKPKDIALQKAKLQYVEEAGIRESHPFYWAGFVLSGNCEALF